MFFNTSTGADLARNIAHYDAENDHFGEVLEDGTFDNLSYWDAVYIDRATGKVLARECDDTVKFDATTMVWGWAFRDRREGAEAERRAKAVAEAVAAERERCARIAEGVVNCDCIEKVGFCGCYGAGTLKRVAAAIRQGQQ